MAGVLDGHDRCPSVEELRERLGINNECPDSYDQRQRNTGTVGHPNDPPPDLKVGDHVHLRSRARSRPYGVVIEVGRNSGGLLVALVRHVDDPGQPEHWYFAVDLGVTARWPV